MFPTASASTWVMANTLLAAWGLCWMGYWFCCWGCWRYCCTGLCFCSGCWGLICNFCHCWGGWGLYCILLLLWSNWQCLPDWCWIQNCPILLLLWGSSGLCLLQRAVPSNAIERSTFETNSQNTPALVCGLILLATFTSGISMVA